MLATLRGHTDRIYDVRFSPDGRLIATGSYDFTARVWDAASGRELKVLRGHRDTVAGVAFTPDGKRLVSGGEDRTVRVWDLDSGRSRVAATLPGRVYRIAVHPDGQRVAASCADGVARIIDLGSGGAVALAGHGGEVNDVAFSADGATVATVSDDRTLQLWEVATGRPRWRAPLLVGPDVELLTHRGWQRLGGGAPPSSPPAGAWRAAAEAAAMGSASADDGVLCLVRDGRLVRWDRSVDRAAAEVALSSVRQVVAGRRGCIALDGSGAVRLLASDGTDRLLPLGGRATAIAWDEDEVLVALADGGVKRFGADGSARGTVAADGGVTALARVGDELVLGYGGGALERVPLDPHRPRPRFSFEAAPSSPVVTLAAGPMSTVLAGYANGVLGQWHLDNGTQLEAVRLHGPVEHLRVARNRLYAATRLGDEQTLDLSVFDEDYCALLRRVWREVPVVWEGGLLVERRPPAGHRCARP
jgi:WD40 repeat protein